LGLENEQFYNSGIYVIFMSPSISCWKWHGDQTEKMATWFFHLCYAFRDN